MNKIQNESNLKYYNLRIRQLFLYDLYVYLGCRDRNKYNWKENRILDIVKENN